MDVIHTRSRGSSTICLRGTTVSALDQHIAHSVCRLSNFLLLERLGVGCKQRGMGGCDGDEERNREYTVSMDCGWNTGITEIRCVSSEEWYRFLLLCAEAEAEGCVSLFFHSRRGMRFFLVIASAVCF